MELRRLRVRKQHNNYMIIFKITQEKVAEETDKTEIPSVETPLVLWTTISKVHVSTNTGILRMIA